MRVRCSIDEIEMDGDFGPVAGVFASCSRCAYETESFGTDEASVRRCLALMREECPNGECNFYVHEEDEDEDEATSWRATAERWRRLR
jgi:hypothetical protein